MKTQRGQAIAESLTGIAILFLLLHAFIFTLVAIQNAMVLHHTLYEAAICSQLYPKKLDCEAISKQHLEQGLIASHVKKIYLHYAASRVEATADLETPFNKDWITTESVKLPLQISQDDSL